MKPISAQHADKAVIAVGQDPKQAPIHPVLLSGGSGTRLWPVSRQSHPKQLLALTGPRTMLQETALRTDEESLERLIVIGSSEHRFAIAEQLRGIGIGAPRIILEPAGRNTGPAATVAALVAVGENPDALVLLMPADHLIADPGAFRRAVAAGAGAAADGRVVLFGIEPKSPATGYGYIESGEALAGHKGVNRVVRFHEKPDAAAAQSYLGCRPERQGAGRVSPGRRPSGRTLKPARPPSVGTFPVHRARRALSGQAHHGQSRC